MRGVDWWGIVLGFLDWAAHMFLGTIIFQCAVGLYGEGRLGWAGFSAAFGVFYLCKYAVREAKRDA